MNRENLLRVADAIEKHEILGLGFNMTSWVSEKNDDMSGRGCGTTACGAGWAVAVEHSLPSDRLLKLYRSPIHRAATRFLDLTFGERDRLFISSPSNLPLDKVTPAMAVATYRYAAEHGIVDWDAACAHLLPRDGA